MERPEHGRLGRHAELPVADRLGQHRQAEHVGQEDELLAVVVALLPGPGEEVDRLLPLGDRQLDLAGERVQVLHERGQDLPQPRVGLRAEALDDGLGRRLLGEIGCHGHEATAALRCGSTTGGCEIFRLNGRWFHPARPRAQHRRRPRPRRAGSSRSAAAAVLGRPGRRA